MCRNKEKPSNMLAGGSRASGFQLQEGTDMNATVKRLKKQPKLKLVRDTGRSLGNRGDLRETMDAFERMDDRASRQIWRLALSAAEKHPRAACGNLRLVAHGEAA
jgi:hypothetical protein